MLVAVRCRALPQQTCDLTKPCDAAMNWTFTVSDKQNTVSAFASTTATTHLAYRPLPTTPCRSTFPENAPLPILAFLHHPLSYRSRQAAPLPCKLAVLESLFTPSFIVFATSAPTTCTNVHFVWRAITVCRFTTRSALGATMRCVRPSHWFVLSLTFTCRPFIGRRISLQLRKPRRPWQDHARTQRHHRRHHSDGGDAPQPRLASPRHVGKQKWAMLSLPLPWTPDGLAYVDDTDSGSHEHFFPAPGFRTTKTSTHSGKARVVGSNEEDKWPLPWVPLMFCVSTYHRLFFSVLIPLYHRDLVSFISLYGLHIAWNGVYYSHRFGIIDLDLNEWLSLAVQLSRGL